MAEDTDRATYKQQSRDRSVWLTRIARGMRSPPGTGPAPDEGERTKRGEKEGADPQRRLRS